MQLFLDIPIKAIFHAKCFLSAFLCIQRMGPSINAPTPARIAMMSRPCKDHNDDDDDGVDDKDCHDEQTLQGS